MRLVHYFQATVRALEQFRHDDTRLQDSHRAQRALRVAHRARVLGEHAEEDGGAENLDEGLADGGREALPDRGVALGELLFFPALDELGGEVVEEGGELNKVDYELIQLHG